MNEKFVDRIQAEVQEIKEQVCTKKNELLAARRELKLT